jgi:HTH-type transcriptional regulator / antitoxin HigA
LEFRNADFELKDYTLIIGQYENDHYQINAPDPIEAIKYRMEQQNLKQKDLVKY